MNPVFTGTWGGDSFELSVNFMYVGQSTSQQGQSSEAFSFFGVGVWACEGPRETCWESIQVPVFFAGLLQGVPEESLALTCKWQRLPSWSWSCQCEKERRHPYTRRISVPGCLAPDNLRSPSVPGCRGPMIPGKAQLKRVNEEGN